MIVVAGGSGTLGSLLVALRRTAGLPVRVVVRDADKARRALGADVDVMEADVRHPHSLPAALRRADVVISAVHGFLGRRGAGPAEVDRDGTRTWSTPPRSAPPSCYIGGRRGGRQSA